jgi:hypothetical protein
VRCPGVEVSACDIVDINPGTSTKIRVRARYNAIGVDAELPSIFIVKGGFAQHSEAMAVTYTNEHRFYAHVQPHVPMRSPTCYYAGIDPASYQAIIIMEDLVVRGVEFCHPLQPQTFERTARRLRAMARYHAHTWNTPEFSPGGAMSMLKGAFDAGTHGYIDHYLHPEQWQRLMALPRGAAVSRRFHDRHWLRAQLDALEDFHRAAPVCVVHGDTHLGNLYIDADGEPGFFDQQVRAAPWHYDVTYHLIAGLDIADRRRWDRALLAIYLDALRGHGIDAPDFDSAWQALRREAPWGLFVFLINEPTFQTEAANTAYAARFAAAVLDWGVRD